MARCTWQQVLSWGVHVGRATWCIDHALAVLGAGAHGVYGVLTAQADLILRTVSVRCASRLEIAAAPLLVLFVLL